MHNIKFIRENSELFIKKIKDRNINLDIDVVLSLDRENRKLIQKKEEFEREKKNNIKEKR